MCDKGCDQCMMIGIDLGTSNSLACCFKDGKCVLIPNRFHEYLTPSAISIMDDGTVEVGKIAKQRKISHPDVSATNFKRDMGSDKIYKLGDKSFTPIELSSLVIKSLVEDARIFLNEDIEEAIISVPAYFDDTKRNATKLAGELAGIKVERIINEPSAAALYEHMMDTIEKTYMVFDFGGGTLDISIVDAFDNIIEIIAVSGDNHLGGNDFDEALLEYFLMEHNLLGKLDIHTHSVARKQAELCKIALSTQKEAQFQLHVEDQLYTSIITREKLIAICAKLFKRISIPMKRALSDSHYAISDIDEIIMVGGSSKMCIVQDFVKQLMHKQPVVSMDCDTYIAMGCGIAAGIKMRKDDIKDVILTDICPFSLGIDVINHDLNDHRMLFSTIIARNTTLPASRTQTYYTAHDRQKTIECNIYQGESMYCDENLFLGSLDIDIPPRPKGEIIIQVTFRYDINGILDIEVYVPATNETISKVIINEKCQLSEVEKAKRLKALKQFTLHQTNDMQLAELISKGESLFYQCSNETRSQVMAAVNYLKKIKNSNHISQQKKGMEDIQNFFQQVESSLYQDPFQNDIDDFLSGEVKQRNWMN